MFQRIVVFSFIKAIQFRFVLLLCSFTLLLKIKVSFIAVWFIAYTTMTFLIPKGKLNVKKSSRTRTAEKVDHKWSFYKKILFHARFHDRH